MNRSLQVVLSVFAWWTLVVLPGVLTLAGVFGDMDADSAMGGGIVIAWIGCFLAQLAMVYVMEHAVGHSRMSWFFIASLLPWVVDWSTPLAPAVGLLSIGVAGAIAVAIIMFSLRAINLDTHGTVVTATVKKVLRNYMNVVINGVYIYRHVLLDIPASDGVPAREVKHWMLYEIGNAPSVGEQMKLRVDPRHPRHYAIDRSQYDRD